MRRLASMFAGVAILVFAGSCQKDGRSDLAGPGGVAHIPQFSLSTATPSGATFTTDKDDYVPGETVNLSGAGWQPADVLDIHLTVDPVTHDPVDWTVTVGDDGSFTDGSYVVQDADLGTTLTLTATSRATGESATATFTDDGSGSPDNCEVSGKVEQQTDEQKTNISVTASGSDVVTFVCIKSGEGSFNLFDPDGVSSSGDENTKSPPTSSYSPHSVRITATVTPSNGTGTSGCYTVTGLGTGTATITKTSGVNAADGSSCKDLSHVDFGTGPGTGKLDLTVTKVATASFDRTYSWTIDKSVDKTIVKQIGGGTATFNYTVSVSHGDGTDGNWQVNGTITVSNPNSFDVTGVDVTDAVDNGGTCTVTDGTNATIKANSSAPFDYTCTYSSAPSPGSGTNSATASWTDFGSPNTRATGSASFDFGTASPNLIDECVDVSDVFNSSPPDQLHTFCVGGEGDPDFSFTYSRTIQVPTWDCLSYDNTATFTTTDDENDTDATGFDSQKVTVCGPAKTGALTIGFWKTTNGQNLIKSYCTKNGNNLGTYLAGLGAGFGPFSNAPTNCNSLATYVFSILNGASATDMNRMLKAQMLGTALDVWFSGPGWTSTKNGGVKPPSNFLLIKNLGRFQMDLTAVCPMVDNLSNGSATCLNNTPSTDAVAGGAVLSSPMSMQAILDFAATTPSFSGGVWYGGDRTKQEILKNIFDQFNNRMAFGSFPTP